MSFKSMVREFEGQTILEIDRGEYRTPRELWRKGIQVCSDCGKYQPRENNICCSCGTQIMALVNDRPRKR